MLENTFLNLSGHGYLHDVRCQNDESYATLNLIQRLNDSLSDDLWIECQFNQDRFAIFDTLARFLSQGRSIILKFDAKYSGFQQCYSGMSEHDPRFILHFHAQLLYVHDYYVEGITIFQHAKDIKNHRILHRKRD